MLVFLKIAKVFLAGDIYRIIVQINVWIIACQCCPRCLVSLALWRMPSSDQNSFSMVLAKLYMSVLAGAVEILMDNGRLWGYFCFSMWSYTARVIDRTANKWGRPNILHKWWQRAFPMPSPCAVQGLPFFWVAVGLDNETYLLFIAWLGVDFWVCIQ